MKIGLYAPDSKIPNLPLMKLSAYHKRKGDEVEFYSPLMNKGYDRVYISKVFKHPSVHYLPLNIEVAMGGSGVDINAKLPEEIEHIYPDYDLYKIDYAMGFLTRGCINSCPFCIVRKKEGSLHKHADLSEFWHGQKKIMLLDNSLTDYEKADQCLQQIIENGIRLNLCQGFNVRTVTSKIVSLLAGIKLWGKDSQWHIAWDNVCDEKLVFEGIKKLIAGGIPEWRIMCFVLVGFNSTMKEDLYRINKLNDMKIDPFVMLYKKSSYCKNIARWVNHKATFKKCTWQEYIKE
jgi:hypothetical protein